jgi:DNA polymerase IIIc chi subunit
MTQSNLHTVNFYKTLNSSFLINSVSLICKKVLDLNERLIVLCDNQPEEEALDAKLWTASQSDFLPHMRFSAPEFNEFKDEIPIILTSNILEIEEVVNIIILKPIMDFEVLKNFSKVFFLFCGDKVEDVSGARDFWRCVSVLNYFNLNFYLQKPDAKWELNTSL